MSSTVRTGASRAHASRASASLKNGADMASAQYESLRERILSGEFKPGQPLIESRVSAECGVSRTPVREALARLTAEGLVEKSERGLQVRSRTVDEILEVHEVRLILDVESARLAAERRTTVDVARLTRVATRERERSEVDASSRTLHREWRFALRQAAHNALLAETANNLDFIIGLYDVDLFRDPTSIQASADLHERVTAAVIAQDHEQSAELVRQANIEVRDRHLAALLDSGL